MAMMTARARSQGSTMVARNASARKRLQPKSTRSPEDARGSNIRNDQVERRREHATCLARQAGPGPRI
jgi:hypothetical protein